MLALLLSSCSALQDPPAAPEDLAELRGVVLSFDEGDAFASRAKLAEALDFLYDHGVDVVFPVAWSHGGPLWPSAVARGAGFPEVDPRAVDPKFRARDALHEVVIEGHRAGLEVVPLLDLTDPKAAAIERALVDELVTFHEVDGVALEAGPGEPARLATRFAALKSGIAAIDPDVKLVCVAGSASRESALEVLKRGACDVLAPRIAARDVVAWKKGLAEWMAPDLERALAARIAPFMSLADGGWRAEAPYVLAAVAHDRAAGTRGEVLASLAALRAGDGALAEELAREPWYGLALVPWRDGVAWRQRSELHVPSAGAGQWAWRADSSGVQVLEMGGNQAGSVTWTLAVVEKADYDLFVWIPPDADVGKRAVFQVARAGGPLSTVLDLTLPRNKGWVYVGSVAMQRRESREVLRLEAEERDPTKLNVAGPLAAVLHRRRAPK